MTCEVCENPCIWKEGNVNTIHLNNGSNEVSFRTKASTPEGFKKVAARVWGQEVGKGLQRLKFRVVDQDGETVYEAVHDVIA